MLVWLRDRDEPIINLDKLTYAGNLESLASVMDDPRHVFVHGDIGDSELVSGLLVLHKLSAVVHLAAESHADRSIHGPDTFIQTNVVGTSRLLEAERTYHESQIDTARNDFRFINVLDRLYVGDHCAALCRVLNAGVPGETYNIGGNAEMTIIDVVTAICSILDQLVDGRTLKSHRRLVTFVTDRPGHDRCYAIDARKIESMLGWKPTEAFASGLRKTVEWYLANEDWAAHVESGEYRNWLDTNYVKRANGA